jgi:hypothetical protein
MSSSPSLPCIVEKCELASLALCQCCKKDLCIDHLNEHANRRNEKLLPYVDKINVLLSRFNSIYDGEQSGLKQLEEWRREAYKIVDSFCEKKRREFIDATTDKQREQLNDMHNRLNDLIRKKGGTQQDFDTFSENMHLIEQHLDKLEQSQFILSPVTIDDSCILRPFLQQNDSIEKPVNNPNKSPEHPANSSEKSSDHKKSSSKSSKKRKKSSRHSDDSSDRSSRHRSRSPRSRDDSSRRSKYLRY